MSIFRRGTVEQVRVNRLWNRKQQRTTDGSIAQAGTGGPLSEHPHTGTGTGGSTLQPKNLKLLAAVALTLASDAVTLTQSHHTIDTQAAAASDDLATANGLVANQLYLIRPANDARTIVVKNGTGNIDCIGGADITLDDVEDWCWLFSPDGVRAYAFGDTQGAGGAGSVATDAIWDAIGDLVVGTGANTAARLAITVPAANILNVLGVVNGETTPTWKSIHDATNPAAIGTVAPGTSLITSHRDHIHATGAGTPSTQAFGDAAATGSGPAAAMTDHKHAMPADPAAAHIADTTAAHEHGSIGVTGMKGTISVPAAAIKVPSGGAASKSTIDSGSSDVGLDVFDLDATAIEYGVCVVFMPDNWDGGVVKFRYVWMTASSTSTHTCRIGLQGRSYGNAETLDQAYGTAIFVDDDATATANQVLISDESADVTLGGTPAAGELVAFRVQRDPTHANDDLNVDARLIAVKIEYGISALSS